MIPNKIKGLMQKLLNNKFEAYIIGGAVRDIFLKEIPHDWDIFTNATGEQIQKIFPKSVIIGSEERQEKILTVIVDDVEISQYRKNGDRTKTGTSLKEHQATCDFTMNSIAMDINKHFIDNFEGIEDARDRTLRFVGNAIKRIKEDPLRVLRGIRFILKYDLECDDKTDRLLKDTNLDELPKERIRDELMKILSLDLEQYFLIKIDRFLPEELLHRNMDLSGGKWHNETPYDHLENSCLEICKITSNPLIRLSVLLHDIGKATKRTVDLKTKEIHFYEHQKEGADIVRRWMNEYKFSSKDIKFVTTLIYNHMHGYLDIKPSKKFYIKLFNSLESAGITIEEYAIQLYGDFQGNLSKKRIRFGEFIKGNKYIKKYYEIKYSEEPMNVTDLKVGGKDVIERLKLSGADIGKILNHLFEQVMEGHLKNDRAELLNYMKTVVVGDLEWKK